jgi:hypothetical protein
MHPRADLQRSVRAGLARTLATGDAPFRSVLQVEVMLLHAAAVPVLASSAH